MARPTTLVHVTELQPGVAFRFADDPTYYVCTHVSDRDAAGGVKVSHVSKTGADMTYCIDATPDDRVMVETGSTCRWVKRQRGKLARRARKFQARVDLFNAREAVR